MAGLFDYLKWRGDISFSKMPLNDVDNLIFSQLCHINLEDTLPDIPFEENALPLSCVAELYFEHRGDSKERMGLIIPQEIIDLLRVASTTERFKNVMLAGFVNKIDIEEQKQFSATTYLLDDGSAYVAFRGTDDTLVGWKESFNISFKMPVPSQSEALNYLHDVAENLPERSLYLGGHSKGGNLATFAAMRSSRDISDRIIRVYNNDGPGFMTDCRQDESYINVKDRIKTIVPTSSVFGMLLNHSDEYTVVKSTQAGLWQHDGFSWEVEGASFVELEKRSKEGIRADNNLKVWLNELSPEQREKFCDALYKFLTSTNATTLSDIAKEKTAILKMLKSVDPETKKILTDAFKRLIYIWSRSIISPEGKKIKEKDNKDDKEE